MKFRNPAELKNKKEEINKHKKIGLNNQCDKHLSILDDYFVVNKFMCVLLVVSFKFNKLKKYIYQSQNLTNIIIINNNPLNSIHRDLKKEKIDLYSFRTNY